MMTQNEYKKLENLTVRYKRERDEFQKLRSTCVNDKDTNKEVKLLNQLIEEMKSRNKLLEEKK